MAAHVFRVPTGILLVLGLVLTTCSRAGPPGGQGGPSGQDDPDGSNGTAADRSDDPVDDGDIQPRTDEDAFSTAYDPGRLVNLGRIDDLDYEGLYYPVDQLVIVPTVTSNDGPSSPASARSRTRSSRTSAISTTPWTP